MECAGANLPSQLHPQAATPKYMNVIQLITVALQYTGVVPSLQSGSNILESERNGLGHSLQTVIEVCPKECGDYSLNSNNLL